LKSTQLKRKPIKVLLRILNTQGRATLLVVKSIEVKDVAERKFLQETNFQEEEDNDLVPERRAKDQMWRDAAQKLNPPPKRPNLQNN
jgi:hypothetical protein